MGRSRETNHVRLEVSLPRRRADDGLEVLMEFDVVEAVVDPHPHPILRVGIHVTLHLQ